MSIEEQIKQIEMDIITPIVDNAMATEYANGPPNLMVPANTWKEQRRNELMDFCTGKKDFNRIDSAFETLRQDFLANLAPIQVEKLSKEWELGVEKINNLLEQPITEPLASIPAVPLRELMNISNESFELYYSTGVKYFQFKDFSKAADIFFLLSLIDFQKHNIWISLGLSEMNIQNFEPALNAFAMAAITNSETPYPYLFSAECCIALGRSQEASTYLTLAKETLAFLSPEEKGVILGQINLLEQKAK